MLSEQEFQVLRELEAKAPGELRYWPTHYMGTTPYIVAEGIGYGGKLFVAMGENGKTANTELRGYEGDRAIAYAKRMTAAANALPHLLKRIEELEAALQFIATRAISGESFYWETLDVINQIALDALRKEARA